MSVVTGGKTIFCEGKLTSLDYKLLNRVVEGLSDCTIVTSGSKFTVSIFAQGYYYPDEKQNKKYIIFRDRDFDAQPTPSIQLLQLSNKSGKNPTFLTYRACVENYLLDANLIHNYWVAKYQEKQENPTSKWGQKDSPGKDLILDWIEDSAKYLKDYQSVRWALGDLLNMSSAKERLKTTWTGGSGELPNKLTLQDCQTDALELINQFKQAVETAITQLDIAQYQDLMELQTRIEELGRRND